MRAWVAAWRSWQGAGSIEWQERRWRSLGTQSVPERVVIHDAVEAASWIGESQRWAAARSRYCALIRRRPALHEKLPRYFDVIADATDAEISRIESVLDWLDGHSTREFYPRQVPIFGLDTKWLESRGGMISDLWGAPMEFRRAPLTVRMRLLDPQLSQTIGGLSDVCASVEELATLSIQPSHVWIVENFQTGFAFAPLGGSVVLMGLGYGVSVLSSIPWLRRADCVYWGDIDTHGFAILSRARAALPQVRSILMDEETLLRCRDLWVEEPAQCQAAAVAGLTPQEEDVFTGLRENRWGVRVRLEQERIGWDYAWSALVGCC